MANSKRLIANSNTETTSRKPLAVSHRLSAFTLIELLVVIGVTGILGAVATGIFINISRAFNKANIIAEIERSGNAALTSISNEVRNASSVSTIENGIEITNWDGTSIAFTFEEPTDEANGYIARDGNSVTDNEYVSGINVNSATFTVNSGANPPTVKITMFLTQPKGAPSKVDFRADTTLETTVTLRNY
jgi:prepilin-type N-terminal cleavage/methylation domain-containing protein